MRTPPPRYQIHKTEKYIQKSQELRGRYDRISELLQSVDWHLARMPHRFHPVTGDYYLLKTGQLENSDFAQVNILYNINSNFTVTLIDIED